MDGVKALNDEVVNADKFYKDRHVLLIVSKHSFLWSSQNSIVSSVI